MISTEKIRAELNTNSIGHNINYLPETGSTNQDAWAYIENGCQDGTLIITDNQQQGKGRRQNTWDASPGKSLTFSFVLYPENNLDKLALFPLLTGLSIVKGIESAAFIKVGLKWPNDIMLSRKKMGGILIESRVVSDRLSIVVGVGLNINESLDDLSKEIKDNATSLKIYTGESSSCEHILAEILNEFEILYHNDWDEIISSWSQYCVHSEESVSFQTEDGKQRGIFQGLSKDGHAEIIIDGKVQTFSTGMVTL